MFPGPCETGDSPGAATDGFTAIRETNASHPAKSQGRRDSPVRLRDEPVASGERINTPKPLITVMT